MSEYMEMTERLRWLLKQIEHCDYTGDVEKKRQLLAEYREIKAQLGITSKIEKLFGEGDL